MLGPNIVSSKFGTSVFRVKKKKRDYVHQDGRRTRSAASCDSEALTSGKKLSWSVWDNGEIISVKLLWKPEVIDAPIRSEIPPQPETSISLQSQSSDD